MLNDGVGVEDWELISGFEGVVGRVEMTGMGEGLDDEGDKVSFCFDVVCNGEGVCADKMTGLGYQGC